VITIAHVNKSFPQGLGFANWLKHLGRPPRRIVLRDICLNVTRGELFGLLGPNGAGKTTLLKLIATLALPDRGSVVVGGVLAAENPIAVKRQIGLCTGEERSFYFRLSVRQNMEFFGALVGLRGAELARRIDDVLRIVDLRETLERRFDGLSSGMRQRLGIARALLADPAILLIDEPTRSVDPIHAEEIRRFLREELVVRRGKTIVMTTNLVDEAWSICDTVAILDRGAIAMMGSPADLSARLEHGQRYEIVLDHVSPSLVSRLGEVDGVIIVGSESDTERNILRVEVRHSAQTLTDLLRALSLNGSLVRSLRLEELRPLDVFIDATRSDNHGD
jgi:ABC-2 type transport system ATP-binding protein